MKKKHLIDLAWRTIQRADRGVPIHPTEARVLAMAYLNALDVSLEKRSLEDEWAKAAEGRQSDGPHGRMGSAAIRVGGSTDPEIEGRKQRR